MSFIEDGIRFQLWHEDLDELIAAAKPAFGEGVRLPYELIWAVFGCRDTYDCYDCPAKRGGKEPWQFYEVDDCIEAAVMDMLANAYRKGYDRASKEGE